MVTQKSGKFFIGSIVTFLIIFGIIKVVLLTSQDAGKRAVAPESMAAEDVAERIKPVAQAVVGEAPVVVAAAPAVEEETNVGGVGEKVVTQVCLMCHGSGLMSAPKLGNEKDWAPRIEKGVDTLYTNAIKGLNMMPARGGSPNLSDDDVKAAVDHMVSLVASPDAEKKAVTPEDMTVEDVVEQAQTAVEEAPVVVAATVEKETSAGGGVGEKVVAEVCLTCHGSGLMRSPKLGNKADWAPRIEKGIDTLYNSAINGLVMMPPRGGRADLSDDDVKAAVDHMLALVE